VGALFRLIEACFSSVYERQYNLPPAAPDELVVASGDDRDGTEERYLGLQ
jgi:hypothetical protein